MYARESPSVERMKKRWSSMREFGAIKFQAVLRGHLTRARLARAKAEEARRVREEQRRRDAEAKRLAEAAKAEARQREEERRRREEEDRKRREECKRALQEFLEGCWSLTVAAFWWLASNVGLPLLFVGMLFLVDYLYQLLEHPLAPASARPKVWRQAIDCCHDRKVTLPVPISARRNDLIGVQWYERFHRYVAYAELRGDELQMRLPIAWNLAGPGGCTPREDRDCQYGNTPFIEMVAIQLNCERSGKACHTFEVPFSWGNQSFTNPTHHNARMSNRNVMYLASFPPAFAASGDDCG